MKRNSIIVPVMRAPFFRVFLIVLFFLSAFHFSFGQDGAVDRKMHNRFRISFGPVFSLYQYPKEMTANPKLRMPFHASFLYEFTISRFSSVVIGPEYFHHGMSFDSYYFAPGHSFLYDGTFDYHHTLTINEIHIPLMYRFCMGRETHRKFTLYTLGGWAYRYLLPSYLVIDRPGGAPPPLYDDYIDLWNEFALFSPQGGSILQAGGGLQRNYLAKGKSTFLELMFRWPISRFIYTGAGINAEMKIRDPNISLSVGFRL